MCRKIALMCRNLLITCHKNIYFSKKMECFIDLFFLLTYNEKNITQERMKIIMKILCFAQMKGGTGKTTISYNVACALAENSKVLVVDFDPQCNLSSNFMFDVFDEDAKTVADLLDDINTDPLDIVIQQPLTELPNLDLFPSTTYLYGTEMTLISRMSRESAMRAYIQKNKEFFDYYDYIIFDTAPSMGIINQNAFIVSDHILLVTDPDCNSARMADVFLKLWGEARQYSQIPDRVDALILNNVERTGMSNRTLEFIDLHPVLSKIKLKTTIPHTTRFKECAEQNKPIQYITTKSKSSEISREKAQKAIFDMIDELKERGIL